MLRIFSLFFLAVIWLPISAFAVEPLGFSMNRGWPDLGRGLSSSLGAGAMNPANVSQTQRYLGGIAANYDIPNHDYMLHAGIADSQTTSLGAEFQYSYVHHGGRKPGRYTGNTTQPALHTHRLNLAVGEMYGGVIHIGLRAGVDIARGPNFRQPSRWSYGLGVMLPLGDMVQIGIESGDWFNNAKSPYQSGNVGGGLGLLFDWLAIVGDVNYRWFVPIHGRLLSAGGGLGFRYEEVFELRTGYRWNPGEDENVVSVAAQGVRFPWILAGDARYVTGSQSFEVGLTVSRAFFVDTEE